MLRTIILAGVALGLLLFIVFVERGSLSTTELEGRKGRVLDNFVRERVTRVELQRHGVKTLLVKVPPNPNDPLDSGGWRVEAPYRAKADRDVVDSLLSSLEWAEARRSLGDASAAEIKQFGLDAPRYRVSFVAGRDSSGFVIGGPAADGGAYLKRSDGPAVFVVSKEVLESLDHDPVDFHDKNLHEGLTALTLERLSLHAGNEERRVQRRAGFFWLEKPWQALASSPELSSLIDALDGMHASRYVADTVKDSYGLAAPRLRVEVESLVYKDGPKGEKSKQQKELVSLRIGAACAGHADESYLQLGEGSVYCVADAEWKKLDKRAEELREQRVLPLDDSAITAAKLQDGLRELSLTTQDQTTRFRLTEQGRELQSGIADPGALGELYAALRAAKVEQFGALTASARTQLEQNALVARFERAGKDDAAYVLHVARAEPLAVRMDDPELLTVSPSVNELLTPMAARFRKKRVLEENEAQFSALTLTRAGGASERVLKTDAGYELATPLSGFAERGPVDEILRLASRLDALRFVADAPRPEHGLAAPYRSLRLEYTAQGKTRTHNLEIGEKTAGGRFAKLDADPAVFVVADALVGKLEQPLPRRAP